MEEGVPEADHQALQHRLSESAWEERAVLDPVAQDANRHWGDHPPASVGNRRCFSTKPHFSHFLRMSLSIGMLASSQLWLMVSKHPDMSASILHFGDRSLLNTVKICSAASRVALFLRNP